MNIGGIELNEELVTAARMRFDQNFSLNRKANQLTFGEYLELFASGRTARFISPLAKVCATMVGSIRKNYFEDILPEKSTIAGIQAALRADTDADGIRKTITLLAREQGIQVTWVKRGGQDLTFFTKILLLNGWRCCLIEVRKIQKHPHGPNAKYFITAVSQSRLQNFERCIILQRTEALQRLSIIPVGDIIFAYGSEDPKSDRITLNIPHERRELYHNIRPRLNWERYVNAWDYLK